MFPKKETVRPTPRSDQCFEGSTFAPGEAGSQAEDMGQPSIYTGQLPQAGTVTGPGPANDKGVS
jgi:hypothetical protein